MLVPFERFCPYNIFCTISFFSENGVKTPQTMPDAVLLKCVCVNSTTEAQETLVPCSYTSFQMFRAQHNLLSFQNRLSGPKGVREDYFVKMK